MTKKQMQERIEQLERELSDLKSQVLALALMPRTNFVTIQPSIPAPVINPWQPTYPSWPTITYSASGGQSWQNQGSVQ